MKDPHTHTKENVLAHDLRSALTTLRFALGDLSALPPANRRLAALALERMQQLLMQPEPACEMREMDLEGKTEIAIVDDDPAVHALWSLRLEPLAINVVHFDHPTPWVEWASTGRSPGRLHLVDLEMGAEIDGLQAIQAARVEGNSVLVTGEAHAPEIVRRCHALGVALLPKALASTVPLRRAAFRKECGGLSG